MRQRHPARSGDPRVQALAGALCTTVLTVTGITNKSLRAYRPTTRVTTSTKALRTIDIHITERIDQARLLPKAA